MHRQALLHIQHQMYIAVSSAQTHTHNIRVISQDHPLPPFEVCELLMVLDPIQGEFVACLSISWLTHSAD